MAQPMIHRMHEDRTKRLARNAAHSDLIDGRAARAAWWVGELSHRLGIVNAAGMIDIHGAVAKAFEREYNCVYRTTPVDLGVGA